MYVREGGGQLGSMAIKGCKCTKEGLYRCTCILPMRKDTL